jgi:SAM-dependent methyltransferase
MFAEMFRSVVIPRAAKLGISPSEASRLCRVQGQFDDERTAIAYCMAYGWMHYASFKDAIDALGLKPGEFPHRPLVVDIGCGPGTALLAFGEWLCQARARRANVRIVGIERSRDLRALASGFVADETLFEEHVPLLLPSAEDLTPEAITEKAHGCDGVVLTMSYVLHQGFMADGRDFKHVVRSVSASRLPVTIIAQDANKPLVDEANVERWPESHLRAMLNEVEAYGYRPPRIWDRRFEARKYIVDERGNATPQSATGQGRTKAIAVRLFPT